MKHWHSFLIYYFPWPLYFQLDAVCSVYETGAAAMYILAGHGAHIDQKPKLTCIVCVELQWIHVLGLYFSFMKKWLTSSLMSSLSIPLL